MLFVSDRRISATEISELASTVQYVEMLYIVVTNRVLDRIIIDWFDNQANILSLNVREKDKTNSQFQRSFEKIEDADNLTSNVPTTPRTTPTGIERLSRKDFFASKLKYRMCPRANTSISNSTVVDIRLEVLFCQAFLLQTPCLATN